MSRKDITVVGSGEEPVRIIETGKLCIDTSIIIVTLWANELLKLLVVYINLICGTDVIEIM